MSVSTHRVGRRLVAVLAIAAAIVGATSTATVASSRAPLGYQLMCLEHPGECRSGGQSSIVVTDDVMSILKRVNSSINRSIKPRRDMGADVWTINASSGDCEDYVLAKRRALIKSGLPASALRIAYVKTRSGEGHAILVVKTDGKDLVLDNLNGKVRPLSQSGYRIISMSGADPLVWS